MPEPVDAFDAVERRGRPDGSGDLALEVARKERRGRQPRPDRVRQRRRAGEDRAILADQREHIVFGLSDRGVEGLQRCDLDERHRDGAVVRAAPADGEAEGAHGLRAHHFADEGFRTAGPVGARIVPTGEVDVRRRPRLAPDDETPRVEAHHADGLGRRGEAVLGGEKRLNLHRTRYIVPVEPLDACKRPALQRFLDRDQPARLLLHRRGDALDAGARLALEVAPGPPGACGEQRQRHEERKGRDPPEQPADRRGETICCGIGVVRGLHGLRGASGRRSPVRRGVSRSCIPHFDRRGQDEMQPEVEPQTDVLT